MCVSIHQTLHRNLTVHLWRCLGFCSSYLRGMCQLWKTSPNVSLKMMLSCQAAQNLYSKKQHMYSNYALCLKNYPQRLAARNLKNLHNVFKGELIFQLLLPTLGVKKLWVLRSRNHPLYSCGRLWTKSLKPPVVAPKAILAARTCEAQNFRLNVFDDSCTPFNYSRKFRIRIGD